MCRESGGSWTWALAFRRRDRLRNKSFLFRDHKSHLKLPSFPSIQVSNLDVSMSMSFLVTSLAHESWSSCSYGEFEASTLLLLIILDD
jgi:hypothetical protein